MRARNEDRAKLLTAGVDPGRARDEDARHTRTVAENTFEKVAREWHRLNLKKWQPRTAENILQRFEVDLFPRFGSLPIADVNVPHVLDPIRAVEERGALEVAKRLTADCSRVFKYAIRCQFTEKNPAALLGALMRA